MLVRADLKFIDLAIDSNGNLFHTHSYTEPEFLFHWVSWNTGLIVIKQQIGVILLTVKLVFLIVRSPFSKS